MNWAYPAVSRGQPAADRETIVFSEMLAQSYRETHRLFAGLLVSEWLLAVGLAVWLSPLTWAGQASSVHPHVWFAIFLGGIVVVLPVFFCLKWPQLTVSRHLVGSAQMLLGSILIHITGGRIETHFHIFCSLAVLAFFRDYRMLMTASAVTLADHLLRGIYWPESIYGALTASIWRTAEHGLWIVTEFALLTYLCRRSLADLRAMAQHQVHLENSYQEVESKVVARTFELRKTQRRLRYLAHHDTTTKLPNRVRFAERLGRALLSARAEGLKVAVLFLDLDRFKQINDTLGHEVGDEYLKQVGRRFRSSIRTADILARIGGDEFAILMQDLSGYEEAESVALKLLSSLMQPLSVGPHELYASVSIGISIFPMDAGDAAALLRNADTAMYQAKQKGKNRYECFPAGSNEPVIGSSSPPREGR